jgi:hypothetical protein
MKSIWLQVALLGFVTVVVLCHSTSDVSDWNCQQTQEWIRQTLSGRVDVSYLEEILLVFQKNEIDGAYLAQLQRSNDLCAERLKSDLHLDSVGLRARLCAALGKLVDPTERLPTATVSSSESHEPAGLFSHVVQIVSFLVYTVARSALWMYRIIGLVCLVALVSPQTQVIFKEALARARKDATTMISTTAGPLFSPGQAMGFAVVASIVIAPICLVIALIEACVRVAISVLFAPMIGLALFTLLVRSVSPALADLWLRLIDISSAVALVLTARFLRA